MESKQSRIILQKLLKSFDLDKDRPNKQYLEEQLAMLNRMVLMYKSQSESPTLLPRGRAMARDLEQNCMGLINGIQFALAFLEHSDTDLKGMIN